MNILQSYDLTDHLWTFLDKGFFPKKPSWRKNVRDKVYASHVSQRQTRMSHDRDFTLFTEHYRNSNPSSIWKIPDLADSRKLPRNRTLQVYMHVCTIIRLNGI